MTPSDFGDRVARWRELPPLTAVRVSRAWVADWRATQGQCLACPALRDNARPCFVWSVQFQRWIAPPSAGAAHTVCILGVRILSLSVRRCLVVHFLVGGGE